jgi:hypothetical protein
MNLKREGTPRPGRGDDPHPMSNCIRRPGAVGCIGVPVPASDGCAARWQSAISAPIEIGARETLFRAQISREPSPDGKLALMPKSFYGRWIVLASCMTFGISVGLPYYNMPFFYDYYKNAFHWQLHDITLGFPLAALLTLWVGPLLVPRFSPRKLVVVGHGPDAAGVCRFQPDDRRSPRLLFSLVSLHLRLHPLRTHSAPDHGVPLVPAQSRVGHGHCLRRCRPHRSPGSPADQAVDGALRFPYRAHGCRLRHDRSMAHRSFRSQRSSLRHWSVSRRGRRGTRGEPDRAAHFRLPPAPAALLAFTDRQSLLHRRDRRD